MANRPAARQRTKTRRRTKAARKSKPGNLTRAAITKWVEKLAAEIAAVDAIVARDPDTGCLLVLYGDVLVVDSGNDDWLQFVREMIAEIKDREP